MGYANYESLLSKEENIRYFAYEVICFEIQYGPPRQTKLRLFVDIPLPAAESLLNPDAAATIKER